MGISFNDSPALETHEAVKMVLFFLHGNKLFKKIYNL